MSDEQQSMESVIDQIGDSMKEILKGDVIDGTVVTVKDDEVIVNIGHFSDGVIAKEELIEKQDDEDGIKVGDVISVYVLDPHDQEGNVTLSQKRAVEIVAWDELKKAFDNKEKIKVNVKQVVKGGVVAFYKTIRCFIPASLLAYRYVEDLNEFVGKELEVRVEDFDLEKKRIVLSRKVVEIEEREKLKEAVLKDIEVGKKYKGVVTKLMNFGAFVDIGGVEGLIHISELSWNRVKHPSEVVAEGDEVEVDVLKFDTKTKKIGLGLKKVEEDPWKSIISEYQVGDIVEGKVVRLTDFGAFVEIEEGIEGLVHVSEISSNHVHKPSDVLNRGDKVEVEILKIDQENKKLSLSIKEAEGHAAEEESSIKEPEQGTTLGDIFGDKLKDFFKE
ncbi:MAG: 30S ribosomal protein S1 [Clostridia bacterium]|nr:30S ribosomal protein S1 [Clostridia bacterium]